MKGEVRRASVRGAAALRRGEDHFAFACFGFERRVFALAGELAVDADEPVVVVDVGPGEAERFADPRAGAA